MNSTQLRTLSHDALVDHVRSRLTGTSAAPAREAGPRSAAAELTSADFLATEPARQLVAS